MMNTKTRGTMDVYNVPNCNTLTKVAINAGFISIEQVMLYDEQLKKGCKYTFTGKRDYVAFTPEDYKQAWREYSKNADALSSEYADMRKAFTYALRIYRRRYGEIFA